MDYILLISIIIMAWKISSLSKELQELKIQKDVKYCVQERKEKQKKKELLTVTYVGVTGVGRDLREQDEIVKVEENK